jgi:type I restriction enzyme R subunit
MAVQAERYFPEDPTTSLIKLRQFGEILAQQVTARAGIFTSPEEPQANLLRRIRLEAGYSGEVIDLFHDLRRAGNEAVH